MYEDIFNDLKTSQEAYEEAMRNAAYKIAEAIDKAMDAGLTFATVNCEIDEEIASILTKEKKYDITVFSKMGFMPITRADFGKDSYGAYKYTQDLKDIGLKPSEETDEEYEIEDE